MDIEEKKRMIAAEIERQLAKDPITLTFSSPHIRGARPFVVLPGSAREVSAPAGPSLEVAPLPHPGTALSGGPEEEDAAEENLSPKELSRLAKAEEKERRKNEKAYEKMRRDIKKRGFGTGLLRTLDDPADIYSLSDDEIRQIEAAGIINSDGYYTFTYPEDFEDIRREKLPKKTVLLFSGFAAAVLILFVILINNILTIF